MEDTTPYNLDAAIQQWRAELAQSPAFKQENLDELESHLRDSVATWHAKGLSEEESFLIASRRVGAGGALEKEFGKLNRKALWMHRVVWMLAGVQILNLIALISRAFIGEGILAGVCMIARQYGIDTGTGAVVVNEVAKFTAYWGLIWLCWRLATSRGDKVLHWAKQRFSTRRGLAFGAVGLLATWGLLQLSAFLMSALRVKVLAPAGLYRHHAELMAYTQIIYFIQPSLLLLLMLTVAFKSRQPLRAC